jgi:hypothetical protein
MTDDEKLRGLSGTVGLLIGPALSDSFDLFAQALRSAGAQEVVRLAPPADAPQSFVIRTLLLVDRLVSRFLPGSRRTATTRTAVDEPTPDPPRTVVVVGAADSGITALTYSLRLGAARDDETVGLPEILARRPVAWLTLERRSAGQESTVVAAMAVQADRRSVTHTAAGMVASAPAFLSDALVGRGSTGPPEPLGQMRPGWREAAAHVARLLAGLCERLLFRSQWVLGILSHEGELSNVSWTTLRLLLPPRDRFWADPFIVERDNRSWLFFEEAMFSSAKGRSVGHVAVAEIKADGVLGKAAIALERDWHLSYPNVFEHDDHWYMIPEQGAQGRVDLYCCEAWPATWRVQDIMVAAPAYDPTLAQVGTGWRLMTARRAPGVATTDFLDVYKASSPLGPWQLQHRSAVADVRCARPGGRIIPMGASLLRPAQDSSGGIYGRALHVQQTLLTAEGLSEKTLFTLEPAPGSGVVGIHTLAVGGGFVVVDLCLKTPRLSIMPRRALRGPFVRRAQ